MDVTRENFDEVLPLFKEALSAALFVSGTSQSSLLILSLPTNIPLLSACYTKSD
jgi:hypothetical protein